MARHHSMDPREAIALKKQGWTHAQIAKEAGLTVSGVQQLLQTAGYVKQYTSHKEAVPWRLAKEHSDYFIPRSLRVLSHLAQGNKLSKSDKKHNYEANMAIKWANEILDANKDVDYDREQPPSEFSAVGGFFLKDADPKDWHLQKLMQRVIAAQTRKL